ncbi:MAG: hypothetical protein ACOH2J_13935 [Allorhizobium sp.]
MRIQSPLSPRSASPTAISRQVPEQALAQSARKRRNGSLDVSDRATVSAHRMATATTLIQPEANASSNRVISASPEA